MTRKEKAVYLIQHTRLSVKQIAKDTGLTQSWLYQLKNGEYKSEDKIDTIYHYLRRRK